jgi:flavin-binding protein dodecin
MSDHVYKIVELTGTSSISVDEAIKGALQRASRTIRNVRWFEVTQIRGEVNGGTVSHYQVLMKVGFTLDDA